MDKKNLKHVHDVLAKNSACYVLIRCEDKKKNGEFQVEMSYEGDISVASYLLQGAQYFMDQLEENELVEKTPQLRLVE